MYTLYEQYAILDAKMKIMEEEKADLRSQILEEMASRGEEKVETTAGKFTITKLKKWTYPESVTAIEEKFKAEKAKAESTGEATYVETDSLRFTQAKL